MQSHSVFRFGANLCVPAISLRVTSQAFEELLFYSAGFMAPYSEAASFPRVSFLSCYTAFNCCFHSIICPVWFAIWAGSSVSVTQGVKSVPAVTSRLFPVCFGTKNKSF